MINFVRAPGNIFDMIFSITWSYNTESFIKYFKDHNIVISENKTSILYELKGNLKFFKEIFFLFYCNEVKPSCFLYIFKNKFWEYSNIENFINDFKEYNPHELIAKVLEYYDNNKFDISYYSDLITQSNSLVKMIESFNIDDNIKWQLILFISEPELIINITYTLLQNAVKLINEVFLNNKNDIERHEDELIKKLNSDRTRNSILIIPEFIEAMKEEKYNLIISFCFLHERVFNGEMINGTINLFYGFNFKRKYVSDVLDDIMFVQASKAFGDILRIKIIKLLLNKSMYLTELSNNINVSITTLAHHVDILTDANILNYSFEGKKTYYYVNNDFIISMKKYLDLFTRD